MFAKLIRLFCTLLVITSVVFHKPLYGALLSSNTDSALITVDEQRYSPADFVDWWENWQEKGMKFPDSPDSYIDWILFVHEAKQMKLFDTPSFRKKIQVFLKVRSLMLLKYEEIDSKITITDEEIWERYQKDYIPLWKINIISFQSQEAADAAYGKLLDGSLTVEDLAGLQGAEGGPGKVRSTSQRPGNTHPEWQAILRDIPEHGFSKPTIFNQDIVIIHLLETSQGNQEEFANIKTTIQKELWKEKEGELTYKLIETLKKKYHVQINQKRLDELAVDTPDNELMDTPLLTFDNNVLTEQEFMGFLRRNLKLRGKQSVAQGDNMFKEMVLNGIISQNLTDLEALNRHYEETPHLKSAYQFYYHNRLVKALEQHIDTELALVEKGEAEKYYEENKYMFSSPEFYRLALIKGTRKEASKALQKIFAGGDFEQIAAIDNAPYVYDNQILNAAEMAPELKNEVAKLQVGEVSKVIPFAQEYAVVKLLDHSPASVVPFTQAEAMIMKNLADAKKKKIRADYLRKLRENASIIIDEDLWQDLRNELVSENASKEK